MSKLAAASDMGDLSGVPDLGDLDELLDEALAGETDESGIVASRHDSSPPGFVARRRVHRVSVRPVPPKPPRPKIVPPNLEALSHVPEIYIPPDAALPQRDSAPPTLRAPSTSPPVALTTRPASTGRGWGGVLTAFVAGFLLGAVGLYTAAEGEGKGGPPVVAAGTERGLAWEVDRQPEAKVPNATTVQRLSQFAEPSQPATSGLEAGALAFDSDASVPEVLTDGQNRTRLAAFDLVAAVKSLSRVAARAGACRSPGAAPGTARVQVTFAGSGRVTNVVLPGSPYAGTSTGRCVARIMRTATVPPFAAAPVTVQTSLSIE